MVYIPEKGESRRDRHGAFIEANIRALAQAAIDGHRKHGRGMLLLDDSDFIDKPRGQLTLYRCVFVAEGSDAFKAMGSKWPGDKEAGWVADYDPESTMLLGITRKDGSVSSYRVDFGRLFDGKGKQPS